MYKEIPCKQRIKKSQIKMFVYTNLLNFSIGLELILNSYLLSNYCSCCFHLLESEMVETKFSFFFRFFRNVRFFGVVLNFAHLMFLRILNLRISRNHLWFVFLQSKSFQLRLKQRQSNFLFQKRQFAAN